MYQLRKTRSQHGCQRKGHHQRHQSRKHHYQGKLSHNHANNASGKCNRQKYDNVYQRNGQGRKTNFVTTIQRSLHRFFAHLQVSIDIFKHHNGVVNQDTHYQRHGQQSHQVEGKSKGIYQNHGRQQRCRNGQHHDDGIAEAVQEKKHNCGYQNNRYTQVMYHRIYRIQRKITGIIGNTET